MNKTLSSLLIALFVGALLCYINIELGIAGGIGMFIFLRYVAND